MPVGGADGHHLQLDQAAIPGEADVEELATRVPANVDAGSADRRADDVEPSSDRGEAPLENLGAHGFPF